MPRGCDHAIHVKITHKYAVVRFDDFGTPYSRKRVSDRYFIVEYDADGNVLRIKERRQKDPPMSGAYDVSYWTAGTHPLGTGDTLPKRIIAAAEAKRRREDQAADATP